MRKLILKYMKAAAAELYDLDINVEFDEIYYVGICRKDLNKIILNKELVGEKNIEEVEYWWPYMIHEITHFEVTNIISSSGRIKHIPKFYYVFNKLVLLYMSDTKELF